MASIEGTSCSMTAKANTIDGPHRIALYRLVAVRRARLSWRVDGTDGSVWGTASTQAIGWEP